MAVVNAVSIKIQDYVGGKGSTKSLLLYIPATVTVSTLNTLMSTLLPALDAVIDGQIVDSRVDLALTLPGGLKSSPVTGQDVHNGATLTYDPNSTDFAYSTYVPTWEIAGFAGQDVLNTGDYATFIAEIISDNFTDRDGNDFNAFTGGIRARRK
jgi:hypothetical protein